jgi:hypothetical protein
MRTSPERRAYIASRLRLLHEGRALVGTPDEYLERHERADADLLRKRADHDNLDLVGG